MLRGKNRGVGRVVCSLGAALFGFAGACDAPSDSGQVVDASEPHSGWVDVDGGRDAGTPARDADAPARDADAPEPDAGDDASSPEDDAGFTEPPFADVVADGEALTTTRARPAYGAVLVANQGTRSYAVESRRFVEPGPFGLPWRTRFRLAAYDAGEERWAFEADMDDLIGDVAVHPSGEISISLQRQALEHHAYALLRFSPSGELLGETVLEEPSTIPATDFAETDPRPMFRMKAPIGDATTAGWLRLLPDGEGLVVAVLSFIDVPPEHMLRTHFVMGLGRYAWQAPAYVEQWSRLVEGPHSAQPAAWAYDELRWREQAVRPFLARDDSSGDLLVGRAWNQMRCQANVATFAEFEQEECVFGTVGTAENERLPLAVTRFGASGDRLGTRILRLDADAAEQVPFALAARDGELAVAGAVVRSLPDGTRRTYPNANGYVDYDGYISFYSAEGERLRGHDFNLGRGDMLAGLRWFEQGVLAVGAAGWDRWRGGMSISRGCDPLFVWLSNDASESASRVVSLSDQRRHFQLHDVTLEGSAVVGHGFADSPMTHSADGGKTAEKTFGLLRVALSLP